MNILHVSTLLGVAAFILHIAAHQANPLTNVSVWPPGPNHLGEYVVLLCRMESNSTFAWNYQWYREKPHNASTMDPRHLVSGESYSITGLTREDMGNYRCKAQQKESNYITATTTTEIPVFLNVSELPSPSPSPSTSPSLTLTPNSRQIFTGESFTVQCPVSQNDSISWNLKHFSVNLTEMCSSPQGAVCGNKCERCVFTAARENSGLYWCQSTKGRSSAISITVSNGSIILKTPALPVFKGDNVNLSCQYRTDMYHEAIFFKNGAKMFNSSGSDKVINVTIYNVTQKDEGFYKCASPDRRMESPESWLSVIDMSTSTVTPTTSTNESWKWIVVSCSILLLFLIPLIVWLVWRIRHHTFSTRSCWPSSKEDVPAVPLPETKQDVTEVQWDLSWMEMSSLLDKQLYACS